MDPFLELGIALRVFPHLYALPLHSHKRKFAIQEHLSGMAGVACTSLGIQNVALRPWEEAEI